MGRIDTCDVMLQVDPHDGWQNVVLEQKGKCVELAYNELFEIADMVKSALKKMNKEHKTHMTEV